MTTSATPQLETQALRILESVFGYESFRGKQAEIVEHVAAGGDAVVLMPTGGGKSLCYQIPALMRFGTGVVISPLIALMENQVDALAAVGVNAAYLNSSLSFEEADEIERRLLAGELDMVYMAPERLVQPRTLQLLSRVAVSLFAIDEAHCVSQWGHDFRKDYLGLSVLAERFPDVPRIAREAGGRVDAALMEDYMELEGANDRAALAELGRHLNQVTVRRHLLNGVTVVDPASTWIDVEVAIGQDATILPNTQLHGITSIGEDAVVGPDTTLDDVQVGRGARVVRTHGSDSRVGAGASVGPFAYLRPGTELGSDGKIGTFVETKNSTIGEGSKIPHLSYVGDATIGDHSNIGAASVFVNYDGVNKHVTHVGAHSFVGSDSVLIAPVTIAPGAYVAAGSAVDGDVNSGQIAVARGRQSNHDGWVATRRAGTPTDTAAQAAGTTTQED